MFPSSKFHCLIAVLAVVVTLSQVDALQRKRDYSGYAVIRSLPLTQTQLENLQSLVKDPVDAGYDQLKFWTEPMAVNLSVDILAGPQDLTLLEDNLQRWNISSERIIEDVGQKIRQAATQNVNRDFVPDNTTLKQRLNSAQFFTQFQRYSVIEAKLREFEQLDPRVSLEIIGKSHEGRNLYLVKVSNDPGAKKPIVLIDGGHHAREWISHATVMYFIESLVNIDLPKMPSQMCRNEACRREVVSHRPMLNLNKYDYWFIPVVNPDGYEYSHQSDRLWRKTRSGSYCRGVDPNRNYPFHWNESGSSRYACSEIYSGRRAMSEPEVKAVAEVMQKHKDQIRMYLSIHCYSQLLLAPYGYARTYPDNYDELSRVAKKFIDSMAKLRNTDYRFGTSAIELYPSSGGSDDYAHSLGIPLAYTLELPDKGKNGFITPPSEIIPIAHETLLGLQSMIEAS